MTATRSWLFVPGNRPDRFDRAYVSGADRVIVDLEDAVAPHHKDEARRAIAAWLTPRQPVFVRVNAPGSKWFTDDLDAVCKPGLAGIMLPKAEEVAAVRQAARMLVGLEGTTIIPLVETARGIWAARRLASSSPRVERLALGLLDLALDLGVPLGLNDQQALIVRTQLVLASRVARVAAPIDSVTAATDLTVEVSAASAAAYRLGFAGKFAIHPRQVPIINAAFGPTSDEVAWATRVVASFDVAGSGVLTVDGVMIDRPTVEQARNILGRKNDLGLP